MVQSMLGRMFSGIKLFLYEKQQIVLTSSKELNLEKKDIEITEDYKIKLTQRQ